MHVSVLLRETIDLLQIKPDGRYVDGTLGLGGHAEAIAQKLGPNGRLLGLDMDSTYLAQAKNRLQPFGDQTFTRQVNFRGLQGVLQELGWDQVDGMLFDLGISSPQLKDNQRGLSFQLEGPLDMRLDPSSSETALSLLRKIDEKKFAEALTEFGEGRNAKRLSRYLLSDVAEGKIQTTTQLAQFCERVVGRRGKVHPATRVFLALRCLVNDELGALKDLLQAAPGFLKPGGRLAIISFHSLEDRLIKEKFRELANSGLDQKQFLVVTRKPLIPSEQEVEANPRSRSAKLRVLERLS